MDKKIIDGINFGGNEKDKTNKELLEEVNRLKAEIEKFKEEIERLKKDSIHDKLTGLKARAFFDEELNENLSQIFEKNEKHRKEGFGFTKISILFIDLDNFKKVNDTYGHGIGDEVLKKVANILKESVRGTDIAARYGGEEFAISFLGADEENASIKAEEIRKVIEKTIFNDYPDLKISASIGVATIDHLSRTDLIKFADRAMYEAKNSGKNKVVKYSDIKK